MPSRRLPCPSSAVLRRTGVVRALGAASLLLVAAGCSSGVSEDAGVVATSGVGSLALVRVERQAEAPEVPARISSSIKVARYRGLEGERLLRLLGAEGHELDTCAAVAGLDELALPNSAHVELLSVGRVALRLGEHSPAHVLSPRLFPALAATASGFFYADAFDGEAHDSSELSVAAAGQEGVGQFALAQPLPEQVSSFELDGAGGPAAADGLLRIERGRAAELAWEPAAQSSFLELELYAGGSVLSCTVRDDGHFSLPSERLAAVDADDNAVLIVRRVHVTPLAVQGVESAYAHLSSARTLSVQVR